MVKINKVEVIDNYVMIEYLSNGVNISARVYKHDDLTPQQIIKIGYEELKSHIQLECDRLNILADHEIMLIEDKVIGVELLGVENISFVEGQQPIEKIYKCIGTTLFGKHIDISEETIFNPSRTVIINPIVSSTEMVSINHNGYIDSEQFEIFYKTLAEVKIEADAIEEARIIEEARVVEEKRIADELALIPTEMEQLQARTVETEIVARNNGLAQQELLELLIDMGVL